MKTKERTIVIHLLSGGTPKQFRAALKKSNLLCGPNFSARLAVSWLRNGREALSNLEIASRVAAEIPASIIHVHDLGNASYATGPNLASLTLSTSKPTHHAKAQEKD